VSVIVPGVMMRTTSRLRSFFVLPGASSCSEIAIFRPARTRRAMYPSAAWCGIPAIGAPWREVSVIWSRRAAASASSKNVS